MSRVDEAKLILHLLKIFLLNYQPYYVVIRGFNGFLSASVFWCRGVEFVERASGRLGNGRQAETVDRRRGVNVGRV